jgi:predicted dehydrogenase
VFRRPRPRREWPEEGRPDVPAPDSMFRHHELLPERRAEVVAELGVKALAADEMARLLLNPYALWDLADLIDATQPEAWVEAMVALGWDLLGQETLATRSAKPPPCGLLVIGWGKYFKQAHLPAVAAFARRGTISVVAVADLKDPLDQVRKDWKTAFSSAPQPFGIDLQVGAADTAALDRWWNQPDRPALHAAIVSTYHDSHRAYARWCLEQGLHVLVDKPLTVAGDCTTVPCQAAQLQSDWSDLCTLSRARQRLFMLATQRRYQPVYREVARRLACYRKTTGWPVTFVQCFTADGWWPAPDSYFGDGRLNRGYDPHVSCGGKIVHTGYHLLDIIPWLMRHCEPTIGRARVVASFFRPMDSFALIGDDAQSAVARSGIHSDAWECLPEINAAVQITFLSWSERDRRWRTACLAQFGMLHEGLSMKGHLPDQENRTKQEFLALTQGPIAAFWMQRIAKLAPTLGREPGGSQHLELRVGINPRFVGGGLPIDEVPMFYEEKDSAPAEEFLGALAMMWADPRHTPTVCSPVADHSIGIKLLSGIYESAARSYEHTQSDRDTPPSPCAVDVQFDEAEWSLPPNAVEYLPPDRDGGAVSSVKKS